MKLRRIIAVSAAAAIAASAVAATASAITINTGTTDGIFATLVDDKDPGKSCLADPALATTLTKVVLTITTDSFEDVMDLKDATWMGGGIGFNSDIGGWDQHEWSFQDGVKELTWVANEADETFTITLDNGTPAFAAGCTYAQVWIQSWDHEPFEFEIVDFQLLNADGVDIRDVKADAPVEDEPVVDEPVVDEPVVEETVEIVESEESEDVAVEETVEIVESVEDEPVADEPVEDEPAVDTDAPTTGDKQSPDTGVEGIAAVAAVLTLAGSAVVASRKRK